MRLKRIDFTLVDQLTSVAEQLDHEVDENSSFLELITNNADGIVDFLATQDPSLQRSFDVGKYQISDDEEAKIKQLFDNLVTITDGHTLPYIGQDGVKLFDSITKIVSEDEVSYHGNCNNELGKIISFKADEEHGKYIDLSNSDISPVTMIQALRNVAQTQSSNQSISDLIKEVCSTEVDAKALQTRYFDLSEVEKASTFGSVFKNFLSDSRAFSASTVLEALKDSLINVYTIIKDAITGGDPLQFDDVNYDPATSFSLIAPYIISTLAPLLQLIGVAIGGILGMLGVVVGTIMKVVINAVVPNENTYGTVQPETRDAYVYAQPIFQIKSNYQTRYDFYSRYKTWLQQLSYKPGTIIKLLVGPFCVYCWCLKDDVNMDNIFIEGKLLLTWSPSIKKFCHLVRTGEDEALDITYLSQASGIKSKLYNRGTVPVGYDRVLPGSTIQSPSGDTWVRNEYGAYYNPVSIGWMSGGTNAYLNKFTLTDEDYAVIDQLPLNSNSDVILRALVIENLSLLYCLYASASQYEMEPDLKWFVHLSGLYATNELMSVDNDDNETIYRNPIILMYCLGETNLLTSVYSSYSDFISRLSSFYNSSYYDWEFIQSYAKGTLVHAANITYAAAEYVDYAITDVDPGSGAATMYYAGYHNYDGQTSAFYFGYSTGVVNKANAYVYPAKWSNDLLLAYWLIVGGVVVLTVGLIVGWNIYKFKMRKKARIARMQADMAAFNDKQYDLTTKKGLDQFYTRWKTFNKKANLYNLLSFDAFNDQNDDEEIKNLIRDCNDDVIDCQSQVDNLKLLIK